MQISVELTDEEIKMYDLTNVLITISAASASFVAILGGFIASKLISINAERNSNDERLKEIEREKEFLYKQNNKLIQELLEEDSLVFILEHISELIEQKEVEDVYDSGVVQGIQIEDLRPFWNRAKELLLQYCESIGKNEELNIHGVPTSIINKYPEDDFAYEVCEAIASEFKKHQNKNARFAFWDHFSTPRIRGKWYSEYEETIKNNTRSIEKLDFEEEQIKHKNKYLNSPKGMRKGFVIFAIFSLLCIVAPLVFSPLSTNDYCLFVKYKIIFIAIFIIGLTAIFLYLLSLLDNKK